MKTVNPTSDQVRSLSQSVPANTPVQMLNLLKFRAEAAYDADSGFSGGSGKEAYKRYSAETVPHLQKVGGKVIWFGSAKHTVIGPPDESWDEMLIVEYPSIEAFKAMLFNPAYQAITFHRTAALEDSRLIATLNEFSG